jgi:hypothetical protein
MADLAMKAISHQNWCEPDPTNGIFGWSPNTEALLAELLRPKLSEQVPIEIARLFETARGAMCYAWFFYPLWTLAAEQFFRVAEAAVRFRCNGLEATGAVSTFEKRIQFLEDRLPSAAASIDWNAVRLLRNQASHPQQQTIISPGMAIPVVETLANALNQLFEEITSE